MNISDRKLAESALKQAKDDLATANEHLERRVRSRTADLEEAKATLLLEMAQERQLEEQLRQAQKMEIVGTLTGGIAHDFNNILNIIGGHANLTNKLLSDNQDVAEALKIICEAVDRGSSIVQQLLAIARKSEPKLGHLDVNQLIERLSRLLKETLPKTIEICLRLDPQLSPIIADPNQIDQVLLNMSLNARDAMPDGGKLLLGTELVSGADIRLRFQEAKEEQYACISVADTGHGMEPSIMNRIFEPFFSTKHQSQGTGLGLSVAYGIIANHRGFIDVTSVPHEATTFKTYLPIWESPHWASDKEVVRIEDKPVRFEGGTILFVEDEPRQLELMRKVLEQEGFRVLTAVNGTEAVEIHLQYKDEISVAVLDLGLPGMSGWEAMKKMKQVDGKLKFVLTTGYLSPEVESEVAGDDRSTIIMKPYQLDEILSLISSLGNKSNR